MSGKERSGNVGGADLVQEDGKLERIRIILNHLGRYVIPGAELVDKALSPTVEDDASFPPQNLGAKRLDHARRVRGIHKARGVHLQEAKPKIRNFIALFLEGFWGRGNVRPTLADPGQGGFAFRGSSVRQ